MPAHAPIIWLSQASHQDKPLISNDFLALAELKKASIPTPNAFSLTAQTYSDHISPVLDQINDLLKPLNILDRTSLQTTSSKIIKLIKTSPFSPQLAHLVASAYQKLGSDPYVSITTSFANSSDFSGFTSPPVVTSGDANILTSLLMAWGNLFDTGPLFARSQLNLSHTGLKPSLIIQVLPKHTVSGTVITQDPSNKDAAIIEAVHGHYQAIQTSLVQPDHYQISKTSLKLRHFKAFPQTSMLTLSSNTLKPTKVGSRNINQQKLSTQQLANLTKLAIRLQKQFFFSQRANFLISGNRILITHTTTQTTPVKSHIPSKTAHVINLPLLLSGTSSFPGIVTGPAKIISNPTKLPKINPGDILVAKSLTDNLLPSLAKATGLITQLGGQTSLATLISREIKLPTITSVTKATKLLEDGEILTINATTGHIYQGSLPAKTKSKSTPPQPPTNYKTATNLFLYTDNPTNAKSLGKLPIDGVGYFNPNQLIKDFGVHPKKLLDDHNQDLLTAHLVKHLTPLCQSFSDRPVYYALSSLTSNDYCPLTGGSHFEPPEQNPLLGFFGSLRHLSDSRSLKIELGAIKTLRNHHQFKNLHIILNHIRTPKELSALKALITSHGLIRSPSFQLWLSLDFPANLYQIKDLLSIGVDGISLGIDALFMLIFSQDPSTFPFPYHTKPDSNTISQIYKQLKPAINKTSIKTSLHSSMDFNDHQTINPLIDSAISALTVPKTSLQQTRAIIYSAEHRKITH